MSRQEIQETRLLIDVYRDARMVWETEFERAKLCNPRIEETFRGQVILGCIEEINTEINGLRELLTDGV